MVSRWRSATNSIFYAFDERGVTTQRLDASGTVWTSWMTDAVGIPGGSAATGDPYDGFGGQWGYYQDTETGLTLCTHRYFDSVQGRWLTRDPIGYQGGVNLYQFVGNSPTVEIDPSGLAAWVEVRSKLGVFYAHAYIRFDTIPCWAFGRQGIIGEEWSYGYWKNRNKLVVNPDPFMNSGRSEWDRRSNKDPLFEKALCACIKNGGRHPKAPYFYVCGSWANDMWNCATKKLAPIATPIPTQSIMA